MKALPKPLSVRIQSRSSGMRCQRARFGVVPRCALHHCHLQSSCHETPHTSTPPNGNITPISQCARALVKFARAVAMPTARHSAKQADMPTQIFNPAALAMAAVVIPTLPGQGFAELLNNRTFWAGFWGWFSAQFLKIFTEWAKKGVLDPMAFFKAGGLPSSHSALCAATATDIALTYGLGSPLFAMAVCFSVIVMYDAAGVRRHAGKQAEVLNKVVVEMLERHGIHISEIKLKEVLGHTPLQVAAGALLGITVGIFHPQAIPVLG